MIRPLGKLVLVKKVAVTESVTAGGVILPQTHAVKAAKAEVIAVGPEVTKVEVDDVVLLSLFRGDDVEYEQETFTLITKDDLLATIDR